MSDTEHYLIDAADRCARIARLGRELAASLESLSNDLMAKAVELDTARDRQSKARAGRN